MKLVFFVLAILMGLYLVWMHSLNPQLLSLPLLGSLPAAFVILAALLMGIALACAVLVPRLWHLRRDNRTLERDLGLRQARPPDPAEPVIPDRTLSLEDLR